MTNVGLRLASLAIVLVPTVLPGDEPEGEVARLKSRVTALETELAGLRAELRNDRLLARLRGRWTERSFVRGGERIREPDEVVWRLETDVNSERHVLAGEVDTYRFGRMSVDATRDPAWIDFEYRWQGETYLLRGLVRSGFREVTLALPRREYDGKGFSEPARPTSFDSTEESDVEVYRLERSEFARTGW